MKSRKKRRKDLERWRSRQVGGKAGALTCRWFSELVQIKEAVIQFSEVLMEEWKGELINGTFEIRPKNDLDRLADLVKRCDDESKEEEKKGSDTLEIP